MTTATHSRLTDLLDAHGGLDRWHAFSKVKPEIVSGGHLPGSGSDLRIVAFS